jgi:hypothetical protein
MITNNEFASRVQNNLKGLTKDGRISKRFILNIAQTKARFLLAQKLDEKTLFREEGIISHVTCFKMKPVNVRDCDIFEFRLCENLMVSCDKIPEGLFGKNGSGIITVSSVDGLKMYDYISPRQYSNLTHRLKYISKDKGFYYIKDGYLYLPNSTNELVDISMIALKKWEAEESCGCEDKDKGDNCKSYLDMEFVCPDRFLDLVQRDTLQELASIYRTSISDENPNLDENIKSRA